MARPRFRLTDREKKMAHFAIILMIFVSMIWEAHELSVVDWQFLLLSVVIEIW